MSHIYDTVNTHIKFIEDGRDVESLLKDNENNDIDIKKLTNQIKEMKAAHEKILIKEVKISKDRKKRLDVLHSQVLNPLVVEVKV